MMGCLQTEMEDLNIGAVRLVFPAAFLLLCPEKWLTVETGNSEPGAESRE